MRDLPCGCVVVECREAATLRATMNAALLRKIAARFDGGDVEQAERAYRAAVERYEDHFQTEEAA